jgi:hypothetical protein
MEVIHARCAGLDVHKQTVVACVRVTTAGRAQYEVRTFPTTAAGLVALQQWLVAAGSTHAVMEKTGVYWKHADSHRSPLQTFPIGQSEAWVQCSKAWSLRQSGPSGVWVSQCPKAHPAFTQSASFRHT